MRTEDVLSAIGTGLWRWDLLSGAVTLDAEAARLFGWPAEPLETTKAAVRARLHPVDWNEIEGVVRLAVAESTLAEVRLRVMDGDSRVVRTVRSRAKPVVTHGPDGDEEIELFGTVQEVSEPRPGTAVEGSSITGDWRRSREAFLLDAGRALAEARSTTEVLRVAASLSMPGFSPDGLAVFGVSGGLTGGPSGQRLRIIGHHGHDAGDVAPFEEMSLDTDYPAAEVVRTGRAVYLPSPEAYENRYPATWQYVQRFDRGSWAFVPLVVAGRTLGTWMAAFKHRVAFSPDERSVLTTVARMLAQALARAGVAESERELSIGLQRSMMPRLGPEIPGMAVAARYVPTGGGLQVGGDWYDMIPLPDGRRGDRAGGRFALVIGDVQGHDVHAAGLMGQLRIALRAYAAEGHSPDAVLSRASRFLAGLHHHPGQDGGPGGSPAGEPGAPAGLPPGIAGSGSGPDALAGPRFATCLYLEVDPETGTLDIARAGHPDPVIRTADGTAVIRQTAGGLPLGVEADSDYPTTRLQLGPGELLMLCTDGLIETGGHDLATGWERLRPVLEAPLRDGVRGNDGAPGDGRTEPDTGNGRNAVDSGNGKNAVESGNAANAVDALNSVPPAEPDGAAELERLADALVQAVHGPTSYYTTGPLADRREDDIALLLLARDRDGAASRTARTPARRTALTIAQAEPERIAGARRQLRDLLRDWADPEQVDSAELMVSEILTNVLVHTDGDALLIAEARGEHGARRLRIEVADTSDDLPHRRRPGELASSGRGLVLLELLADAWGVDPRGEGKCTWFELYEDGGGGAPVPAGPSDPAEESAA
ncbi:SpoIIE family protein phosphatase [Streptomyces sp. NPDC096310]|uniref:ATP-binding SpoIIE family protein phosphatase n=1 Tax=Streptomyces sp. NPDC096310 TaxID=3366082 RepID=UPI00381AACB7